MCYSAQIEADHKKMVREFGATMDLAAFTELWLAENSPGPRKIPKALADSFLTHGPDSIRQLIEARAAEQRLKWEAELFTQRKRLGDAERKIASKPTKAAENSGRIARGKVEQLLGWLRDLSRREPRDRDARIYPGSWAPVICVENGQRVIRPMRYQCRPAGKPATYDAKYPGTYNARRDNLGGYWRGLFGHTHGVLVAHRFFEHVEGPDGQNRILEFMPRDGSTMLIACLWSRWTDPTGSAPDLLSFAAITDEPEPEVAAAGHDRTVINLRPEHLDAWLSPSPGDLAALHRIFDDKRHPYYEHRIAA